MLNNLSNVAKALAPIAQVLQELLEMSMKLNPAAGEGIMALREAPFQDAQYCANLFIRLKDYKFNILIFDSTHCQRSRITMTKPFYPKFNRSYEDCRLMTNCMRAFLNHFSRSHIAARRLEYS